MSMQMLITSAGRRGQLLQCFREAARKLQMDLRVLTADLAPNQSAACRLADGAFAVPRCTDTSYIRMLLELCRQEQIALLVPTIDTELLVLSQHAKMFHSVGTRVVISSPEAVSVARNKALTSRMLEAAGVSTPRTMRLAEYRANPDALSGSLIAKPIGGSSSIGLVRGSLPADFTGLSEVDYIVQELRDGVEYTVNLFLDQQGVLRCAVPHRRIEVRAGEVSKGRTERVPVLEDAARRIAAVLTGAQGPLCFQAIVDASGNYAVFEINARFGGGYPLAHRAGAQFANWLLEEAAGLPCTANNDWKAGVTMLRYDAAVYIDD